jgi:hypothetical protein
MAAFETLHITVFFFSVQFGASDDAINRDDVGERNIQASLVIRDLTLCVFAITRFREKTVRKLYSNFAVTVYGGGVIVWRAYQPVTSYQYQCEREC